MTKKLKHTIDPDKAWQNLFRRLDVDGLIPEENKLPGEKRFRMGYIRWVAAVLIIGSSIASFFYLKAQPEPETFLSLQNEKGAVTLVTTLEDGSVVYLADNTELKYPEHFATEKRVVTLTGNALFDVTGNKECPFLINTEMAHIEVLGTSFHLNSGTHEPFELIVKQGNVKVTDRKTGRSVKVNAGEKAKYNEKNELLVEKNTDLYSFSKYEGSIRFRDEALRDIIRVINHSRGENLLKISPSIEYSRINFTFKGESNLEIAELISTAMNINYIEENDSILITD